MRKRQSVPSAMIFCGRRLDEPQLTHPKRVEPKGIVRIVVPPIVVRHFIQRLQSIIVTWGEFAIDKLLRDASRLRGTEISGLQKGAYHTLGRNRILAHEVAVARQHTAEVLRPGIVQRAVGKDMAKPLEHEDPEGRRASHNGVQLSLAKQLGCCWGFTGDPGYVLDRIQADMRRRDHREQVATCTDSFDANALVLEVGDGPNAFTGDQFQAPDMNWGQARDRVAAVDPGDESSDKMLGEIHRAVAKHIGEPGTGWRIDPVDVGEAVGTQQLCREILRREAGGRNPRQAHRGDLKRLLRRQGARNGEKCRGAGQRKRGQEAASCLHFRH